MKKLLLLLLAIIFVTYASSASAVSKISLFVNNKPITPSVPLEIKNSVVTGPVEKIAEALGAKVTWDPKNRIMKIDNNELMSQKIRLSQMEAMVDRSTANIVATQWCRAVLNNSGWYESLLLSKDLNTKLRDQYIASNYNASISTGCDDYRVDEQRQPNGSYMAYIIFDKVNTSISKGYKLHITKNSGNWYISQIEKIDNDNITTATFPYTFDIPDGWVKGMVKGSLFPDLYIQPPTPETSPTDKYFVSPGIDVTLLDQFYNVQDIISGMKTYKLNTTVTKAGQYKCELYNGTTTSAHKAYIRNFAFIYTDKNIVFIDALGDDTQKARIDGIITALIASFGPRK